MDVSAVFTLQEMIVKMQTNKIKVALILKERHAKKVKNLIDAKILKSVKICTSLGECNLSQNPI